jgi:hypothetical protein
VFVSCRFTDTKREREGQASQVTLQVCGVLAGGIDTNVKMNVGLARCDFFQGLAQLRITFGRFGDAQIRGRALAIGVEEGDLVKIPMRVDSYAHHGLRGLTLRHHRNSLKGDSRGFPRLSFDRGVMLVISGLAPHDPTMPESKVGGINLDKELEAQP